MKKDYKIPKFKIALMVISFLLAFLDMSMLREAVSELITSNSTLSAILAFGIATIANTLALDWGISNANHRQEKTINKNSIVGFAGWLTFAVVYLVLKLVSADWENILDIQNDIMPLLTFVGELVILAASYIFSGLSIESSAREIFNPDAAACRKAESVFNELHHRLARSDARIDKKLSILEDFESNYEATKIQYLHYKKAILGAERAACSEILGKTLQSNPDIDPALATQILEEILVKREAESEKLFK